MQIYLVEISEKGLKSKYLPPKITRCVVAGISYSFLNPITL